MKSMVPAVLVSLEFDCTSIAGVGPAQGLIRSSVDILGRHGMLISVNTLLFYGHRRRSKVCSCSFRASHVPSTLVAGRANTNHKLRGRQMLIIFTLSF